MPGEPVQLTDPKGRSHLITLRAGASFHPHRGTLSHDDIISGPDGNVVTVGAAEPLRRLPPLLAASTPRERGAAVVYPRTRRRSWRSPTCSGARAPRPG
jgi:tRNA (adenine57-N1/adenine58-N1)-methyltransferase